MHYIFLFKQASIMHVPINHTLLFQKANDLATKMSEIININNGQLTQCKNCHNINLKTTLWRKARF